MSSRRPHAPVRTCIAAGLLAYLVLPWYAIQDTSWWEALPQVFGPAEGADGVMQALLQGRSWLWIGLIGLALRGGFGGDAFVSGAVTTVAASIVLFTAWPILRILVQAFQDGDGILAPAPSCSRAPGS